MEAICAICGEEKELCESARVDGIKQPIICKDCLITSMETGDYSVKDAFWLMQMKQLNDTESIENLLKGGKIMKYHCGGIKSNESLCKLVTKTPATWVFDREGFLGHHYKEGRCKICSKLLNKLSNKE